MCDVYCGCPKHADDQTLIGLYKQPVQRMLDRSYGHSCKWHYMYSIPKCCTSQHFFKDTCESKLYSRGVGGGGVAVPNRLASLHMGVSLWVINDEVICGFKIKGNIVMEQCRVYPDQEELWTQRCHLRSTSLSAFPVWGRSSGPVLDTYG